MQSLIQPTSQPAQVGVLMPFRNGPAIAPTLSSNFTGEEAACLVLDAGQAAECADLGVGRERVGVSLHERRLYARYRQQLCQVIQAKIGHACACMQGTS